MPEQQVGAFRQALLWREVWRTEMASHDRADAANPSADNQQKRPRAGAAAFAAQIARAEFRQFYWDAKKQTAQSDHRQPTKKDRPAKKTQKAKAARKGASREPGSTASDDGGGSDPAYKKLTIKRAETASRNRPKPTSSVRFDRRCASSAP